MYITFNQFQFYCGFLPFVTAYELLRYSFLVSLYGINSVPSINPFNHDDIVEMNTIALKYGLNKDDFKSRIKFKMWKHVERCTF